MAFNYRKSINGAQRNLELVLLNNSVTLEIGDVVEVYSTGYANVTTAAQPVFGIIHSIVGEESLPKQVDDQVAGTASTSNLETVTTAADNTTTLAYWALIDTSNSSIYSAEVSGTLGTTNSSNVRGAKLDADSANTDYGRLLETTATRTIGTPAQFYSWGLDTDDSTRLLVNISLSELDSVYE